MPEDSNEELKPIDKLTDIIDPLRQNLNYVNAEAAFGTLVANIDDNSGYKRRLLSRHEAIIANKEIPDIDGSPSILVLTSVPGIDSPNWRRYSAGVLERISVGVLRSQDILKSSLATTPYELRREIDKILTHITLYRGTEALNPLVLAQAQILVGEALYEKYPDYSTEFIDGGLVTLKSSEDRDGNQSGLNTSRRNDVLEIMRRLGKFYVEKNNFEAALNTCALMSNVAPVQNTLPGMYYESDEKAYAVDVLLDIMSKLDSRSHIYRSDAPDLLKQPA